MRASRSAASAAELFVDRRVVVDDRRDEHECSAPFANWKRVELDREARLIVLPLERDTDRRPIARSRTRLCTDVERDLTPFILLRGSARSALSDTTHLIHLSPPTGLQVRDATANCGAEQSIQQNLNAIGLDVITALSGVPHSNIQFKREDRAARLYPDHCPCLERIRSERHLLPGTRTQTLSPSSHSLPILPCQNVHRKRRRR